MWQSIKRFVDDLQFHLLASIIILIVFAIIGASYLLSGVSNPTDMQEMEQVTQSTRVVLGQSLMATGIATAFLTLLMPVISTRIRWRQEDQLVEIQKTVNILAEQNKSMSDMLNRMAPRPVETDKLHDVEVVITEPTS